MKKVMIIGDTWEQEPLIQKAKELGLKTIVIPPLTTYSTDEFERIEKIFLKHKPDAVVSDECDYSLMGCVYLTNKYNLPGLNMDSVIITSNKYLQRTYLPHIKQPNFMLCCTFENVKNASKIIGYPLMLKPVDNRGSIGIQHVTSQEQLFSAFYDAFPHSPARQLIVEEYIKPDIHVNIEGLYLNKFYNLTYSTKKKYEGKSVDEVLHYPGDLPDHIVEILYNTNEDIVKTIGITSGLTHTEFIIKDNIPYFIEIHNRGGGINVSNKIVPAVTCVDTSEFLIKSALGEKVTINPKNQNHVILKFFDFGVGKVKKVEGYQVKNFENILTLWLNFNVGDELQKIENGPTRHGCVIVKGENREECEKLLDKVENTLKVIT